ncbi:ribonuclease H-like domain-containing protein [Cellulomonas sp. WB94]|uniref:ribonuclease H-like domain-containing protein n=1 Tax=Cellulomonas sp. WB94 TaxID=2173174 RepID=UPI001304F233|nr:ribonuclease H-like domain-containing protein [Cellulomonas sp. WB94]
METAPAVVYTFGFFKQYIRPEQVIEPPRMLCFAARFLDKKRTEFYSEFHNGHLAMVNELHRVLDEADVVVHFNGKSFDEPWARTEILQAGLRPPSPYRSVDLYQQSKRFYLPSHKLEYVSTRLIPAGGKESTGGFGLWVRCMAGDPKAWRLMRKYNLQDVDVMMPVYNEMLPWMTSLPNVNLYDDGTEDRCRVCGSTSLHRRGFAYTTQGKFQRYQCTEPGCGAWSRSTHRLAGVSLVEVR